MEFKDQRQLEQLQQKHGINRIRLEFKVGRHETEDNGGHGINRIRLEFKGTSGGSGNGSSGY